MSDTTQGPLGALKFNPIGPRRFVAAGPSRSRPVPDPAPAPAPEKSDDELYFPEADAGYRPVGHKVQVQLIKVPEKTKGGLILAPSTIDNEQVVVCLGKITAMGSHACRDKVTGEPWSEGPWFEVGQVVRVPRYGGDTWTDPVSGVTFKHIEDEQVIAVRTTAALRY